MSPTLPSQKIMTFYETLDNYDLLYEKKPFVILHEFLDDSIICMDSPCVYNAMVKAIAS